MPRDAFFFQAEDGIRDRLRSRGLGDVYKRQKCGWLAEYLVGLLDKFLVDSLVVGLLDEFLVDWLVDGIPCLLYTSDAADEL